MASYLRSSAVLAFTLVGALFLVSCGDDDPMDPDPPDPTTGSLRVTVNVDGSAQSGITVRRYAPGSDTPAGSMDTGADGTVTFENVAEGDWDVDVDLPEGFELADGEDARKTATVVAGQTATAAFALVDTFDGELITASDDLTFSETSLSIPAGTAVRWVNGGAMLHTVTPDGHTEWVAASLDVNGAMFTHTFDTPGTYDYYCEPHQGQGMTGTIIVQP